jgi:dTMP kinase
MAVVAIGSAFGTWWVNTAGRRFPRHVLLGSGLVLGAAGMVAFAVSTRFAVFAGAALLVGLGAAPAFVLPETMLQENTEARQRGRIFSARDFLMRLLLMAATAVATVAVPLIGITGTLLLAALMMAGVGALALSLGRGIGPAARS